MFDRERLTDALGEHDAVVMIYRDGGNGWIGEDWPVDRYPVSAGNQAAEALLRTGGGTQ